MNEAGLSYAERLELERRCEPLEVVLDLIERVPCEDHAIPSGSPCEPRACTGRAVDAGFANLITLAELDLIASRS